MRVPGMRSTAWVISDGGTLAGVRGGKLLWSRPLPEGAAALNRLGGAEQPLWLAVGGTLIMAQPDGIVAIDVVDGSTVWQASTPVDSWAAAGEQIVVVHGGQVTVLTRQGDDLPEASAPPTAAATASAAPGMEDLSDATLSVPEQCAPVGEPDGSGLVKATFVDGVATGQEMAGVAPTVTISSASPTVLDGKPASVVTLSCYGGGNTAYSMITVYGQDNAYLGGLEPERIASLGGMPDQVITDPQPVGPAIIFSLAGVQIAGDQNCHACRGSASATVTAMWSGSGYDIADVLYQTPDGEVRMPRLKEVQAFYDAVASGDDATAGEHADQAVLASLEQSTMEPGKTKRELGFPPGGRIKGCYMPGPQAGTMPSYPVGPGQVHSPGLQPGDVVCPVVSDDPAQSLLNPAMDASTGRETYLVWLKLRPDGSGSFRVTDLMIDMG
ncbi:hypothetical protein ACSL103130_02790 [Actinomyces slackii]|uniref:Uncharacterized protein n=2 Tax=Actinomyces slackii TaxID=52774 RepID=A0A448KE75_9ACTO|nr:Uncharacterised protein [Actinomyces slackii]